MNPVAFIVGVVTFGLGVKLKKPLRQATVFTASQLLNMAEILKVKAFEIKEDIEDIVAEAQYENIQNNLKSKVSPEDSAPFMD